MIKVRKLQNNTNTHTRKTMENFLKWWNSNTACTWFNSKPRNFALTCKIWWCKFQMLFRKKSFFFLFAAICRILTHPHKTKRTIAFSRERLTCNILFRLECFTSFISLIICFIRIHTKTIKFAFLSLTPVVFCTIFFFDEIINVKRKKEKKNWAFFSLYQTRKKKLQFELNQKLTNLCAKNWCEYY